MDVASSSVKLPGGLDVSRLKKKHADDAIFNEKLFSKVYGFFYY